MSLILAPDFSLPPLSRASHRPGPSKASLRAARELVHSLSIDMGALPKDVRSALCVDAQESAAWSSLAGRSGASLVVMLSEDAIELWSTAHDRERAFRGVMESLLSRVQVRHELGRSRTVERRGSEAARSLFLRAAGMARGGGRPFLARMHRATATASAHATLGPTLASVFRTASNVSLRVRLEATTPSSPFTLSDLECLTAERIVEEELAAWQSQEAELGRAADLSELVPIEGELDDETHDRRACLGDEPGSQMRLRCASR
jgi:hypothetical protein